MIRKAIFSIVLCVAAIGTAIAQAEDPGLRKEVQALYAQWDKLIGKSDNKGLMAMIHSSFKQFDADGRIKTYTQIKNEMESMKAMFKEAKSTIKVDNVYRDGDEVTAWVTMSISFKADAGGGKWTPTSFTGKFVETFKRFNGKLMFVRSQSLP